MWPKSEGDHMEIGSTGFIVRADGWLYNSNTGESISPSGELYNRFGELVKKLDEKEAE